MFGYAIDTGRVESAENEAEGVAAELSKLVLSPAQTLECAPHSTVHNCSHLAGITAGSLKATRH